jgi:hypothetical protein
MTNQPNIPFRPEVMIVPSPYGPVELGEGEAWLVNEDGKRVRRLTSEEIMSVADMFSLDD